MKGFRSAALTPFIVPAIAVVAALAFGNICSAVVIGNFEAGSFDGWLPTPGQSSTAILVSVPGPPGNTLGASSLGVDNTANTFWGPSFNIVANGRQADFLANRFVKADVTFRGSDLGNSYGQVSDLTVNDANGAFIQHANISSVGSTQWNGVDHTATLTWDLNQYLISGVPARQYYGTNGFPAHVTLWLSSQGGQGPYDGDGRNRIYWDNIRLAPEPASLVLVGIGIPVLAMVARRRWIA